jgi:FixJ family two-component response regulator
MPSTDRLALVAIVEDDAGMLRSIERLLVIKGFTVETYGSAEAFLNGRDHARIACLVLDIQLPKMSGLELRQRLSATYPDLPVIFITAIEDHAVKQAATEIGCVAYLRKPFEPESLVTAVAGALRGR